MKTIDLSGRKFGLLTVTAMLPNSMCISDCDCGKRGFITQSYSVSHALTKSCGCLKKAGSHRTHGESAKGAWTPEYRAWVNMITRCHNPRSTRYADWGGRGISVYAAWRDDYEAFLAHVGRKPSPCHSLDRFPDKDGMYAPGNVRWATPEQQARNQRRNRIVSVNGESITAADWAERSGIKGSIIIDRLNRGWSAEDAVSIAPKTERSKHA